MDDKINQIVLPGDVIGQIDPKKTVKLGQGLWQKNDTIIATKSGILKLKNPITYYVENNQRRYIPAIDDNVIGIVTKKLTDEWKLDIGCDKPATLSINSFEGIAKKYKNMFPVGSLIYARVRLCAKDIETEVVCVDHQNKGGDYGALVDGYMFNASTNLIRQCMETNNVVLNTLGEYIPYEVIIGVNGRIWVNSAVADNCAMISRAICYSENMNTEDTISMVRKMHDAQMDYYSKRLATCSSDRKIKVFEVSQGVQTHIADLVGHAGPVWQLSWAHPKYGSILASCSYDRSVIIWKESSKNTWNQIYTYTEHEMSVNSLCWAPHEYGLHLAAASSDGNVSVLSFNDDGTWSSQRFQAHSFGVNSVCWVPFVIPGSIFCSSNVSGVNDNANSDFPSVKDNKNQNKLRIITGGSDNLIKIWVLDQSLSQSKWSLENTLSGHKDWVRDVQWAPNIGLPTNTIASGSQDGVVFIWVQENPAQPNSKWTKKALEFDFGETIWRLSWSLTGNILAVSSGDNKVTLWKESMDGDWKCISSVDNQ